MSSSVDIVVVGCTHGELDVVYATVERMEQQTGRRVAAVLLTGDVQATRNEADLATLAAPPQHLRLGDFPRYYSGQALAPRLTICVGGNHEAALHMAELPLGGWLAPNMYFLGHAGVVRVAGLRIGGVSGIHKSHDASLGHWERPPFAGSSLRSHYHSREVDAWLMHQAGPLDVFLSHDWPPSATLPSAGHLPDLLRRKPHLADDIAAGRLGNPLLEPLAALPHTVWASSHLHCLYTALLPGGARFIALDKPLPGRHFIQWLTLPSADPSEPFMRDPQWCAILRNRLPSLGFWSRQPTLAFPMDQGGDDKGDPPPLLLLDWETQWKRTVASHDGRFGPDAPPGHQTALLLEALGVSEQQQQQQHKPASPDTKRVKAADPNELDISDEL